MITFALPEEALCQLWIYNNATCEVVSSSQQTFGAGTHTISWVAIGQELGEYVFRLQIGETIHSITMTLAD